MAAVLISFTNNGTMAEVSQNLNDFLPFQQVRPPADWSFLSGRATA
jgi:hypothetical protein